MDEMLARLLAVADDVDAASSCSLRASNVASSLPAASSSPSRRQGAQSLFGTASHDGFGRLPAMVVGKSGVTRLVVMAAPASVRLDGKRAPAIIGNPVGNWQSFHDHD